MSDTSAAALQVYDVRPVSGPLRARIRPPGSKSITNRALIIAAIARGTSQLSGALDSQDTQVMLESLRRLGITANHNPSTRAVTIVGCGGKVPNSQADLYLENSGTSIRFLTALCALGSGEYRLDGNARMRERPIGDLVGALQQLGIETLCEQNAGFPPVVVRGQGLAGGRAHISGNVSSQFLSGLLMAAPGARGETTLRVPGELVSVPYVEMTLAVMREFGVTVERRAGEFLINPQSYLARDYAIEPDASAASYFLAAAAATRGTVTVEGLSRHALQGDVRFADILAQMGCQVTWQADSVTVTGRELHGIDVDMGDISDTAQTLAAIAPLAQGPTRIRNVAHMRHKETDRVAALVTELRKLGQQVEEFADGLAIEPREIVPASIATYHDHRMAMSFAVLGLVAPGIRIEDPGCTGKTYPDFFFDLERVCAESAASP